MKVAMLTPCFWPEVRRGTERMVRELSDGLIARGHSPYVLTSHPGRFASAVEDGLPVVRVPRPPGGRLRQRMYEDHMTHVPLSYAALRARGADVAHAWYVTDALAAGRFRRVTGRPAVFSYMGVPDAPGLTERRRRLRLTQRALSECDVVVALSRHAARAFERWLGYDAPVIHPPIDVGTFTPDAAARSEVPTIVCAAAAGEPRKRVGLLVEAFALVRRERPDAKLLLDRPRDPRLLSSLSGSNGEVVFEALDDRAALAGAYRRAWVSALPSVGEAFGLVLAEAMACGTPVVCTDRDGMVEVADRPEVGRTFDGGAPELARALLEALELAEDAATPAACRARAEEFSRERCAAAYEQLYSSLLR